MNCRGANAPSRNGCPLAERPSNDNRLKWSSQSVRLKARGSVQADTLSQTVSSYLQEFKAELNLYSKDMSNVLQITEKTQRYQSAPWTQESHSEAITQFKSECRASETERFHNLGDLTPISQQSNEHSVSRICSGLSAESKTLPTSPFVVLNEEKFKTIEPSTQKQLLPISYDRICLGNQDSHTKKKQLVESILMGGTSGIRSLLNDNSFCTPNSFSPSQNRSRLEMEVGQQNKVGSICLTKSFVKAIRLKAKSLPRKGLKKKLQPCYRKVTLECMVPNEQFQGCVQELVGKANSLGVIVLR